MPEQYETVADIISNVEYRLVDTNDDAYSNDNIVEFFNDAMIDLSESNFFMDEKTVVLSNSATINMANELDYRARRIFGVEVGEVRLYNSPNHEMQATSGSAAPVWYQVNGGEIKLSSTSSASVKVIYSAAPATVTATDNLDARVKPYANILCAYVEYRIRISEQDFGGADRAIAEYNAGKQNLTTESRDNFISGGYGA
jgi:hypothetical protein